MKRILVLFPLLLTGLSMANAQEVGLRFGDVTGGNVAIDAVFGTAQFHRIHADVSFGHGVGLDAAWDFIYRPFEAEALHYYIGAGPYAFLGDPT